MKKLFSIFLVLLSLSAFSQNIKVVGPDTTTGRPGYLFTLKPQYLQTPLYAVNDSTAGSHAIDSLKRSPGTDSVYGRKNGVFVFQYLDSVGTGGSGGGIADSAYFWSRTGNVALSTNWIGTKTATSFRTRTNNTERMVVDSNGNIGMGTPTPVVSVHVFGTMGIGDSITSTNASRQFNVIGLNAVSKLQRVSTSSMTAGPSYELVHSYTKDGATDVYWDMFADSLGFGIRNRTGVVPADTINRFYISKANFNVGINTNRVEYPSAILALGGTSKGFLPPVMTTANRNAIVSPATGLTIYNTSTSAIEYYNGSAWQSSAAIGGTVTGGTQGSVYFAGVGGILAQDNASLFFDDANNRLGIGNAAPSFRLDVGGGGAGATNEIVKINAGATGICGTYYYQNGTVKGLFGLAGTTNDLIAGSVTGDFNIRNSQRILFSTDAGTTAHANINSSGRWFFGGSTSATAIVHLKAGTATANTAPLKFTSGTNLTTAEAGAMEYNGTNLFFTRSGTTRESVITANAVNTVSPTLPNRTITVVIDGTTYYISAKTTND